MTTVTSLILILLIIQNVVGPPVTSKTNQDSQDGQTSNATANLESMGIEYNRYLTQVVEALESDPEFRKKLETAEEADIRSGKIAQELDYVHHQVRTKLDELKREELNRLRHLARQAYETENDISPQHLKEAEHLDHANPHSFEIADLHKLISKVTSDLEEADKMRRKDFKEYEMQKKFEEEQKLKQMDEEHQKQYLHSKEEQQKLHDTHDPILHPGSKQQLKEVWEKQDHMENQDFDPKIFFYMHDLDGNGVLDPDEVKTLFLKELDKMYQAGAPEDDLRERAEDMERMREHVFSEMDTNKDYLISLEEFLQRTKNPEFEKDQGWETADHDQVYTPEEYKEFEHRRQEEIERLIAEGKLQRLPPPPAGMQPPPPIASYEQGHYPQQGNQPQYYQGQVPQYNAQQGQYQQQAYQGQQYQSNNIPQAGSYNAYPQQPASNNFQQQPSSNNIPQAQQQIPNNIPQAQQQIPNNNPQVQQQIPNNIPQSHQQIPNNIPQSQQQIPNNIPQQPLSNNIPQQPLSNNIPQQPVANNMPQPPPNNIPQQSASSNTQNQNNPVPPKAL